MGVAVDKGESRTDQPRYGNPVRRTPGPQSWTLDHYVGSLASEKITYQTSFKPVLKTHVGRIDNYRIVKVSNIINR